MTENETTMLDVYNQLGKHLIDLMEDDEYDTNTICALFNIYMKMAEKLNTVPAAYKVNDQKEQPALTFNDAKKIVIAMGYDWCDKEIQDFLDYNISQGRTGNWEFAAGRWEHKRQMKNARR